MRVVVLSIGVVACFVGLCDAFTQNVKDDYTPSSAKESLTFLKSLPPIQRKVDGKPQLVQVWKDKTTDDIASMKTLQFGGHIEGGGHLQIKGDDWKYLTAFEQLEIANLWEIEGADDRAFYHLGHLSPMVTTLNLELAHAVTAQGIKHLRGLKNLKTLGIGWSNGIDDEAVTQMAEIPSLEQLNISGCPEIRGSGLKSLAKLKRLKTLRFAMSALTDAALVNLDGLGVEELDLSKPPKRLADRPFHITFDGIKNLLEGEKNLPRLKTLTLMNFELSNEQIGLLRELRPDLVVVQ